ncbi:hypothetical protein GCM10010145_06640 [Streptomyces ruber]|uniref:Resolvase/invertase-type recombinase catalytic domain-containing protein n=2 Tax=Streptomyces TaxID=1883 RepID=A0A918ENJ2_9ACTN|nr:recombinase family protein [Streptomyces ruber]GGQ41129.1 hypothetical protein GCM10010145_06640 [Streptomyces ruber]
MISDPRVLGNVRLSVVRPGLGPWFNERADEWDVLAVWKLDRPSRKAGHFAEVFEWLQKHGKVIVSVTEGIDMSTPMGKMSAQMIAAFAEGESDLSIDPGRAY